jgi:malonyl-ACP decarboxylase
MMGHRPARVTGMGTLTAFGMGVRAFAAALHKGSSGIKRDSQRIPELGGFLIDFDFSKHLSTLALSQELRAKAERIARRAPRSVQCSLLVCLEAWTQAGLADASAVPPERISVVIAGQNISAAYHFAMFEKFVTTPDYLPPSYALHFLDTDHVGAISELLQAHGEGGTIGAASASGNAALLQGLRLIRQDLADVCVVVGPLTDISPLECQAFRQSGALGGKIPDKSPTEVCRPFDVDRDGFIYGQGAACMILENPEFAARRRAPDWGNLCGGAISLDGNKSSDLNAAGAARAMRLALEDAGSPVEKLQYINAHATSSIQGDEQEIQAIRNLLGPRSSEVWVNATKELTGHCLWSAGVIEAVGVLVQMKEGFLHPNPNLAHPIADCRFVGRVAREVACTNALSNSFGFGGINTALFFERCDQQS